MKEIIEIKNLNNDIFVYWVLTDFCNQHCTYCKPELNLGACAASDKFPSDLDIEKFIDRLITAKNVTNRRLVIDISGGEPTLHSKCGDIIERLHDHAILIMNTNGTRSVGWWRELPKLPHMVILSLHPEYYDSKRLRINELSEFLYANNVALQFNLMCQPDRWDTVLQIVDDIDDRFRPYIVPKILQYQSTVDKQLYPYTSEQLNFIKTYPTRLDNKFSWVCQTVYSDGTVTPTQPNTIMAEGQHYFNNWKCSAGSQGISVYADGKVRAGICNVKSLGHISNFNLLDEYITCPRPNCICPGDIFLSKYKV
jgi:organic radical activating enzyme